MEGIGKGEQQHEVEYAHSTGSNLSDSPSQDHTTVPDCCKDATTTQESPPPSSQENHPNNHSSSKNNITTGMTESEVKIRQELETDVERGLEEELKEGIYRLALRLHRLYQHKRESNTNSYGSNKKRVINKKVGGGGEEEEEEEMVTEVTISIKMEGGSKMEMKETKGSSSGAALHVANNNNNNNGGCRNGLCGPKEGVAGNGGGKGVCWERTLRSGTVRASEQERKGRARGKVDGGGGSKSQKQTWKL